MSSTEDPLLAIWEAMNLIEKAQDCSNAADLPEILAKAEIVLSKVLKEFVQNANLRRRMKSEPDWPGNGRLTLVPAGPTHETIGQSSTIGCAEDFPRST